MKSFLSAALAVASLAIVSTAPAQAWVCVGPEYVCGDSRPAKAAPKAAASKATKPKATATYSAPAPKSAPITSSSSYSGGGQILSGIASYYWQPQKVASGGWFNPNAMTAAHKTLPFGTKVRVTNKNNGKSVVVTINDRGPYIAGRIIDLSKAAAGVVGMQGSGIAPVSVAVLGK